MNNTLNALLPVPTSAQKSVLIEELMARRISFFDLVTTTTTSRDLTVRELLDGIKGGRWREEIEELRQMYKNSGESIYKESRKTVLGAVTVSGLFRARRGDGLVLHSGLIAIDLDHLGMKLAATKKQIIHEGLAFCVFTSPSGDGLKVLLPVDANDDVSHRAAYSTALERFKHLGVTPDSTCRDPSRLCFVTYDPDIWVNCSPSLPLLLSAPAAEPAPTPTICTLHLHSTPTLQQDRKEEVGPAGRIKRFKQLEKDDSVMADLYELHVSRRINVEPGKRNEALTALVPYLFRAVGGIVAEKLVTLALTMNQGVYNGAMDEHMKSLQALWNGCDVQYPAELSPFELEAYLALDRDERDAFRIMRDLAIAGKGQFFMSCDQLQHRLGNGCNGWRLLQLFRGCYRIIDMDSAGTRRAKGVKGRAASWRWTLPLPLAQPIPMIVSG
jgi:hypothetical protein